MVPSTSKKGFYHQSYFLIVFSYQFAIPKPKHEKQCPVMSKKQDQMIYVILEIYYSTAL